MDNMFRFIRSKIPAAAHLVDGKPKEKTEFIQFQRTVQHGFPAKPSCLAYDFDLNLLALGTKTGVIKLYGAPGVEFAAQHIGDAAVQKLYFLPNQGRLISLCEDGMLHLWEVNFRDGKSFLDYTKDLQTEGRLKKISCCCLRQEEENLQLLIGTESGNVYQLDTRTFELHDFIIYQDNVVFNTPEEFKLNPGAVEALALCPTDSCKLLIGYNRGLIVLWDKTANSAIQTYVSSQQVEDLHWSEFGDSFMSAHNDGSYVVWHIDHDSLVKPEKEAPKTPYGPFPCKPITKLVLKKSAKKEDDLLIFAGGMPRASYADRNAVTAQQGSRQVAFEFTSRVVDFLVIDDSEKRAHCLFVLCEEELVAIDLLTNDWPVWQLPYLHPLHASPITTAQHFSNIKDNVWNSLVKAGQKQIAEKHVSKRDWPIRGGTNNADETTRRDVLVTGHEDGTVKIWSVGGVSMNLIFQLNTARLFQGYEVCPQSDDEEWPPFRKVCSYDPFSDDPRFGIQRLALDVANDILVVGGAAGQIIVYRLVEDEKEQALEAVKVDIVSDRDGFVWKGHDILDLRSEPIRFVGFVPESFVQLNPPAALTSLALNTDYGVVGIGTAHGFALFDYVSRKIVHICCTLNANDLIGQAASAVEGTISRFKSFKKSLRQSFRRRRRPASPPAVAAPSQATVGVKKPTSTEPAAVTEPKESQDVAKTSTNTTETNTNILPVQSSASPISTPDAASVKASTEQPVTASPKRESPVKKETSPRKEMVVSHEMADISRPIERAIEARSEADVLGSMVRSMHFADTYVMNAATVSHTFWVGTNAGTVYIHILSIPESDKRSTEGVQCQLAKEIQLRHRAPVMAINVVESHSSQSDHPHKVLICSEEQLKSFHLPSLKPGRHKFKLTATEGSRIRKVEFISFQSKLDESKTEQCIVVSTNLGELQAFSIHNFKRFASVQCIKRDDLTGIASIFFSRRGEAFYSLSSSELQRVSLSARFAVTPECTLSLPEGARPPQPSEATEPAEAEKGGASIVESPEAVAVADQSILTVGSENDPASANTSVLPTDMTLDSIRDYISTIGGSAEDAKDSTATTEVVVTTKITKSSITHSPSKKEADALENERTTDATEVHLNGDADDDDIAAEKLKAMKLDSEKIESVIVG